METQAEYNRRDREGYFERYFKGVGIDIGCGTDKVTPDCRAWDQTFGHGDATLLTGVEDQSFDWVYSSHCLEHLTDAHTALQNWWRVLKDGGHLVVAVPHRDLYERKNHLPSLYNPDHKHFWLPVGGEPPCTFGLLDTFRQAIPQPWQLISLRELSSGPVLLPMDRHPAGPYSIEMIVRKGYRARSL